MMLDLHQIPLKCKKCNNSILIKDCYDHAMLCKGNQYSRHNMIRNHLYLLCKNAGFRVQKEVDIFMRGRCRSADVYCTDFSAGMDHSFDCAITHGIQQRYYKLFNNNNFTMDFITNEYENQKFKDFQLNKNEFGLNLNCKFIPFIMTSNGSFGKYSGFVIKRLSSLLKSRWRLPYSYVVSLIKRTMVCKLQKGNFEMFKRCFL